jgi:hypothetical protein
MVEKTVSKKTVSLEKANFPSLGTVEKSVRQEQIESNIPKINNSEKERMVFVFL